jgi:hypothetical protein
MCARSELIRAKCCTTADARKIPRDLREDARDVAGRKMKIKAFERSRDERKRVEMSFAHLKTHHRFERIRLRGLSGARDEFHLVVQNLKTLALRILGLATKPTAPIVRLKSLLPFASKSAQTNVGATKMKPPSKNRPFSTASTQTRRRTGSATRPRLGRDLRPWQYSRKWALLACKGPVV